MHAIIVQEATDGLCGGEVAARIPEHGPLSVIDADLPMTGYDTIVPLPRREHHYLPGLEWIVRAAQDVMAYP